MVIELHEIDLIINLITDIINKLKNITHIYTNNNSYYSADIESLRTQFHTGIYNKIGLDFRKISVLNDYITEFMEQYGRRQSE